MREVYERSRILVDWWTPSRVSLTRNNMSFKAVSCLTWLFTVPTPKTNIVAAGNGLKP